MHAFDLMNRLNYMISKNNIFHARKTLDLILNRLIDEHKRNVISDIDVQKSQQKINFYFEQIHKLEGKMKIKGSEVQLYNKFK